MKENKILQGIGWAVLATFIWSGNFVVARGVYQQIPPISLGFFRWALATVILLPFAWKRFSGDWSVIRQKLPYFFWISLCGVSLFNTFLYVGAHYTTAINLVLISTTSSPIMSNILARIFLKEKIGWQKILGMALCIIGVLYLLSHGQISQLAHLQFSEGDCWALLAALSFAGYNTLVKKKPEGISPVSFLFTTFLVGTILLIPFFIWENYTHVPVAWNAHLIGIIAYLGIGASIISFMLWNKAIGLLGAGRTSLFGNLIPIFSSLEAVIFLHEEFNSIHIVSAVLVFLGLLIANIRR